MITFILSTTKMNLVFPIILSFSWVLCPHRIAAEPYISGHYEVLEEPITPSSLDPYGGKSCFSRSGATYITPHFSHFDLQPSCSLTIVDSDGGESETYREHGRKNLDSFWAFEVDDDTFCIVFTCGTVWHLQESTFTIDQLAVGNSDDRRRTQEEIAPNLRGSSPVTEYGRDLSLCGVEDFDVASAYKTSSNTDELGMYEASKAVAKINMSGIGICTGFLVGRAEIMTARHCFLKDGVFRDDIVRDGTTVDFMYESGAITKLSFSSKSHLGNGGSNSADWVLLDVEPNAEGKLPGDLIVPLDVSHSTPAVTGNQIYIPQHPHGRPKEIVSKDTFHADPTDTRCKMGTVTSSKIRYTCDTQGGSSGAPIVDFANNKWHVVGLHSFGSTCVQGNIGSGNGGLPVEAFQGQVMALMGSQQDDTTTTTEDPSSSSICVDDALWRSDSNQSQGPGGRTCSWVGDRNKCDLMFDADGVSALQACECSCGGTNNSNVDTTTTTNADATTTADVCQDMLGWTSTNGKSCHWIARRPSTRCGKYSSASGVRDVDACCACQ